jgi:type IX secretion system PorP/SprF family membrane protein
MRKIITILMGALISLAASAQQRPINSLYMFDPLLINPAYTGTQVQFSATAVYRNQWVNFPGAPKTFTFSASSGFKATRVGVGILAGVDQIGIHKENTLYLLYSYKIPFSKYNSKSYLSFGLQGGFNDLKSDFGVLNPKDQTDPFYGVVERNMTWNFGGGVYLKHNSFYAGLSVPYVLNNEVINAHVFSSTARQYRYYYIMAGFTKVLSPAVKVIPSTLIRVQEKAPLSFDFNVMTVLYDAVGLGVSYRLDDSVVGLFELKINENFHVGYANDFTTSDLARYSNSSHEIMVNYRIRINKWHKGIECPSYY